MAPQDVHLEPAGITMAGSRQVQVSLNVLNLFNQGTAVAKYST